MNKLKQLYRKFFPKKYKTSKDFNYICRCDSKLYGKVYYKDIETIVNEKQKLVYMSGNCFLKSENVIREYEFNALRMAFS